MRMRLRELAEARRHFGYVRTTVDTYGHLANEDLRAPLELLPKPTERALPPRVEKCRVSRIAEGPPGSRFDSPRVLLLLRSCDSIRGRPDGAWTKAGPFGLSDPATRT